MPRPRPFDIPCDSASKILPRNVPSPAAPFLGYINVKKFPSVQTKIDEVIVPTTSNTTTAFLDAKSKAAKNLEKRPGSILIVNGTIPPLINAQRPITVVNATRPLGNTTRPFALPCNHDNCKLPSCRCGNGARVPGNLPVDETPQLILLTFDDAVTATAFEAYRIIFEKNWTNPNGCPIRGTFYLSGRTTRYDLVNRLYWDGHEIASHSVTHVYPPVNATRRFWEEEIYGQKENLNRYGGVPLKDIKGMRAPFLETGGDFQYEMLAEKGFLYDSSFVINYENPPLWPYTFEFKLPHGCLYESSCPKQSYTGLWEMPMVQWESDLSNTSCPMVDTCSIISAPSRVATYDLIMKNFKRHYNTNRAPFGIFMHAPWFEETGRLQGLQDFLHSVMQYDDVWIVTTTQAIQWIKNPTTLTAMETKDFSPWSCENVRC